MRRFVSILGNTQKLDGGAMFGHVPKAVWSKWLAPDEKNRITLACRALLVQEPNRNILLETGIGAFFEPAMRERFGVEESQHVLLDSLRQAGLTHEDIDVVIISHLHFDHAGGLLSAWQPTQAAELLFPRAQFVVGKEAWQRARKPHVRDRASFIPALNQLLSDSSRLHLVDGTSCEVLGEDYRFMFTHGHTPGLMHTLIQGKNESPVIFASDLIPGIHWVHLPVTMGYDRSAELLSDEKQAMLEFAIQHDARLFYTHDPVVAMSRVSKDEHGKYTVMDAA